MKSEESRPDGAYWRLKPHIDYDKVTIACKHQLRWFVQLLFDSFHDLKIDIGPQPNNEVLLDILLLLERQLVRVDIKDYI